MGSVRLHRAHAFRGHCSLRFSWLCLRYNALREQLLRMTKLVDHFLGQRLPLIVELSLAVEQEDQQADICKDHRQRHRLRAERGCHAVSELASLFEYSGIHDHASESAPRLGAMILSQLG